MKLEAAHLRKAFITDLAGQHLTDRLKTVPGLLPSARMLPERS